MGSGSQETSIVGCRYDRINWALGNRGEPPRLLGIQLKLGIKFSAINILILLIALSAICMGAGYMAAGRFWGYTGYRLYWWGMGFLHFLPCLIPSVLMLRQSPREKQVLISVISTLAFGTMLAANTRLMFTGPGVGPPISISGALLEGMVLTTALLCICFFVAMALRLTGLRIDQPIHFGVKHLLIAMTLVAVCLVILGIT